VNKGIYNRCFEPDTRLPPPTCGMNFTNKRQKLKSVRDFILLSFTTKHFTVVSTKAGFIYPIFQ